MESTLSLLREDNKGAEVSSDQCDHWGLEGRTDVELCHSTSLGGSRDGLQAYGGSRQVGKPLQVHKGLQYNSNTAPAMQGQDAGYQ